MRKLIGLGWDSPISLPSLADLPSGADRIRAVAASAFPILAIPEDLHGAGCALTQVAGAQRDLGMIDPSTAIALTMHTFTIGVMTAHWRQSRDQTWMLLEAIADNHSLVASAFAEPGGNGNFMRSKTIASTDGTQYTVRGTKFPCSLATTAQFFCLSAKIAETDESIVALCPAKAPGLHVDREWNSIGMRASDTARVVLDNVTLDHRLVVYRAPADNLDALVITGLVWFVVLMSATYHGILSRLFSITQEHASPLSTPGGQWQRLVGSAARELLLLGTAILGLARTWDQQVINGEQALAAAMALRAGLSDARDRIVRLLTPVLGSRLYNASDLAASLALDSLAVHHHPPGLCACDEAVGAYHFGHPMRLDATR